MAQAIISRKGGGGGGYATITFDNVTDNDGVSNLQVAPLSVGRSYFSATSIGGYALFGGGLSNSTYSSTVDAYNSSLTRSTPTALNIARYDLAATTVGNYALFGGGAGNGSKSTVDVYYPASSKTIQLYPNTKYKFSNMSSEATSSTFQEITLTPPISGYIKIAKTTIN